MAVITAIIGYHFMSVIVNYVLTFIDAYMMSCVDYWNTVFIGGSAVSDRLQSQCGLSAAALPVTGSPKYDQ